MKIEIKQKLLSLGDGYEIFVNNKKFYTAFTQVLTMIPTINLAKSGTDQHILSIEKNLSFYGPDYSIKKRGKEYNFVMDSWISGEYSCAVGSSIYTVYSHIDTDYSVFKDNIQIAYWRGQSVTFLEGDKYEMQANADANIELLIAFCLIIDNHYNNSSGLFNFNMSLFGFRKRKFNENWSPS